MRSQKSSNWVKLLPKIVNDINSTQNQGIGMLVPRSVQNQDGDIIIQGLFYLYHQPVLKFPLFLTEG